MKSSGLPTNNLLSSVSCTIWSTFWLVIISVGKEIVGKVVGVAVGVEGSVGVFEYLGVTVGVQPKKLKGTGLVLYSSEYLSIVDVIVGCGKVGMTVEVVEGDTLREEVGVRVLELVLHEESKASETAMTMCMNLKLQEWFIYKKLVTTQPS